MLITPKNINFGFLLEFRMIKLKLNNLIFLLLFTGFALGQDKQMKVYLSQSQFYTPESGSYIETGLNFYGYTLNYISRNDSTFAELDITQIYSQNGDIVVADRYLLKSPLVIDSLVEDFYDIQRYSLQPGKYQFELIIKDLNSEHEASRISKSIDIENISDGLAVSQIIAAESIIPTYGEPNIFTKIGYDVVPMIGNYYPTELQNLLYYWEVYNSDKYIDDSIYIVEQKLIGNDTSIDLTEYTRYYRYKTTSVRPVSKVIDISSLPKGSYTLELNILDKNKTILARSSFDFDRNNTDEVNDLSFDNVIMDPKFRESITPDSLAYYVASLIPISGQREVKNILSLLKEKNQEKNFKYLQAFWLNVSSKDPYGEWMKYKAQVQLVERLYATNYQVGFETDRGRVYLQYGAPNSIYDEASSPAEYPYEIWQYDRIKNYSNRRFIFYNPTNLNNHYQLLHSDMLGELQNKRWQYELNRRDTPNINFDDPTGGTRDHFGGNSRRYFNSY